MAKKHKGYHDMVNKMLRYRSEDSAAVVKKIVCKQYGRAVKNDKGMSVMYIKSPDLVRKALIEQSGF